jgi:DNA-binding protein YbaB
MGEMKDLTDLTEQIKQLQVRYNELFEIFKAGEYKGTTPKNEIQVSLDGIGKMKSLNIDPNFDVSNRPYLEAMLFIAFNAACDAYLAAYQKYQRQLDAAQVEYTNKALKEYRPQSGFDTPEIKWTGTKKIDGEEN